MSEPRLLIHVGYPKCGSTWLQETLFKQTSGFLAAWAGDPSPIWGTPAREARKLLITPDELSLSVESISKFFEPGLQTAFARGFVPVLSDELLLNTPTGDGDWEKKVAELLHAVFPTGRVLIVIREQKSMIMSSYRHYILTGGNASFEEFIGLNKNQSTKKSNISMNFLKYHLSIELYQGLFGAENVLVLPMELLRNKPKLFTQKIIDFSGARGSCDFLQGGAKNIGYKGGRLAIQRELNYFCQPNRKIDCGQPLSWLVACKLSELADNLVPQSIHKGLENRSKQLITERVKDLFKQSNLLSSQLIKMNLVDFGYDC